MYNHQNIRESNPVNTVSQGAIHTYGSKGVLTGRLLWEPSLYPCRDGSLNCVMKVAVLYHQGEAGALPQEGPVRLEHFCPSWEPSDPRWEKLRKGDLVTVRYAVRTNIYSDKEGKPRRRQLLEAQDLRVHPAAPVRQNRRPGRRNQPSIRRQERAVV